MQGKYNFEIKKFLEITDKETKLMIGNYQVPIYSSTQVLNKECRCNIS